MERPVALCDCPCESDPYQKNLKGNALPEFRCYLLFLFTTVNKKVFYLEVKKEEKKKIVNKLYFRSDILFVLMFLTLY